MASAKYTINVLNGKVEFDYYKDLQEDSGVTVPMPYTTDLSTLITYLIAAGLMSPAPVIVTYANIVHQDDAENNLVHQDSQNIVHMDHLQ